VWTEAYELSGDPVLSLHAAEARRYPSRGATFVHRTPPDIGEHERAFGCPVPFEAPHNRKLIDRAWWDAHTTRAQPGVLELLGERADLLCQELPRGPEPPCGARSRASPGSFRRDRLDRLTARCGPGSPRAPGRARRSSRPT
jgi:hypothetical protein